MPIGKAQECISALSCFPLCEHSLVFVLEDLLTGELIERASRKHLLVLLAAVIAELQRDVLQGHTDIGTEFEAR